MKTELILRDGRLVDAAGEPAAILVYVSPSADERREIIETFDIDPHDLESALDPEEISRLELTPGRASIIWKRPINATVEQQLRFDVGSVGLFLVDQRLVLVARDESLVLSGKEFTGVATPLDVFIRFLVQTVHHYLAHLKVIKQITVELGSRIGASMETRLLMQMFALRESIVYYQTSVEANGAVLMKLDVNAERFGLPRETVESIHDLIIDNQQCARQAKIQGIILSSLVDARDNIAASAANQQLRNLTLINIIFLPLNLLASIGGMSEYSMMTSHLDWKVSYGVFLAGMLVLGWSTWILLVRTLDNPANRRSRKS